VSLFVLLICSIIASTEVFNEQVNDDDDDDVLYVWSCTAPLNQLL